MLIIKIYNCMNCDIGLHSFNNSSDMISFSDLGFPTLSQIPFL